MVRPHILILPPWFDIDFQHNFSKSYHRWAEDLALRNEGDVGLLYGDFQTGLRARKIFLQPDLKYHYLGVRSWGMPKWGLGWNYWVGQYLGAFEEYVNRFGRPTVIHGFSLLGLIAAGAIQKAYQVPYVYTEVLGSMISGKVPGRLIRKARPAARDASTVGGISPGMVLALGRNLGVDARLIPLYLDCDRFSATPFPTGPVQFVSVGSPAFTKGMDILISAMRYVNDALPDAHLTIVAEPRDEDLLNGLIRKHELKDAVKLKGPLPYHAIPGLLEKSHVLISASREESFGYTMVEALASGRPVVASPTPGAKYLVGEVNGQIVQGPDEAGAIDERALAEAMIAVADHLNEYDPVLLHDGICRRFGKDRILDIWTDIYLEASTQAG